MGITAKVIDSVNDAKKPFVKAMANINKSLASNSQEQERFVDLSSDFIDRLANHIRDEVLYPHLDEVYPETLKENKQNSFSSYTDDVIEPKADSQPEIMNHDSITHKKSSEPSLSQSSTENLSSENGKHSSVDLPVHSSYQTIDEISKKQEELKVEIREKQEANVKYEKRNSELKNDFDNYQRRIESLDRSKSKDLPIIENLSKKAIWASHLINSNNSVIENNKNIIMGKLKELGQLEKQKQNFYTQDHFPHMESLSDSDAKSKDKISSNLLLKTLSNIGNAIGIVGRLIFCFAFDLKASEQDINKILKSEPTQEGKNKNRGCFSFMDHFFGKSKFNIPEPTYMSNMHD